MLLNRADAALVRVEQRWTKLLFKHFRLYLNAQSGIISHKNYVINLNENLFKTNQFMGYIISLCREVHTSKRGPSRGRAS